MAVRLAFTFTALFLASNAQPSPFVPQGPVNFTSWSYGSYLFPKNINLSLSIYAPSTASGTFPLMFFLTSFEGMTPSKMYSNVLERIASRGIIIVAGSKASYMKPAAATTVVTTVLGWIENPSGLLADMEKNGVKNAQPDIEKGIFLAGHSAGCHGMVQYLNGTCGKAKGLILMDPVDGFDPWGLIPAYIIKPGTPVPFATPVLHLECGLDPDKIRNFPPCAPAKMSNSRFANAMRAQVWQLNGTAYGHMDMVNPAAIKLFDKFCPSGTATHDPHLYYDHVAGSVISFFEMIYYQNWQYEKFLITPTLDPVTVLEKHWVGKGYPAHPTAGYCTHF